MKTILSVSLFKILATGFLIYSSHIVKAQSSLDNKKRLLLAVNDQKTSPAYLINNKSVIVYPDLLKGNEEQTLGYIEKFSSKRRDYIIRMFTKGKKYLPKAAVILQKQKLPEELKVLLILESAYNGNVVSSAGAVGYWQIMDEVAKEYGMKYVPQLKPFEKKKILKEKEKHALNSLKAKEKERDDRKNFVKSSQVAARYLKDRRVNLHDNWLLVVASYNCGVGNVWSAMEKSGKANPTFWDIKNRLPAETRAYVMNFITLNVLFHNYENFAKKTLRFYPENIVEKDNFYQNVSETMQEVVQE